MVMIRAAEQAAIEAGAVDLAFRRWANPRVRVGTQLRTGVGVIEVTALAQVDLAEITDDDARRAGSESLAALRKMLRSGPNQDAPVYRVQLRWAGPDPRIALRQAIPADAELVRLRQWLDRLDRSGAARDQHLAGWTRRTLRLIGQNPGLRAPDLAAQLGRETLAFKTDVRKLKEKGLTESLEIGYLLSPRGAAVLGQPELAAPGASGTPLPRVGAAAVSALRSVGIARLEDLSERRREAIAALRGVGPVALARLDAALAAADLGWAVT